MALGKTVGELLQQITSKEWTEWLAYYSIEPFGEERADLRAGMITSPLINIQLSKTATRTKPSDWILEFDSTPPEPQSMEEMKMILKGLADSYKVKEGFKRPVRRKIRRKAKRKK